MRWLFCVTPPADGPANMALDEALMRRARRTGEAVFRVYGWSAPTLSLGRNQRARDCYDLAAAREAGVTFVRRPTGGRALLHHREITYSAALPLTAVDGVREARNAYDFINTVLLDALESLGVPAVRATGTAPLAPGLRPCFDAPAEREIAVGGRKLVGSAQWRHDAALLQHGSILVGDDQHLTNRLLRTPAPDDPPPAATLEQCLGRAPRPGDVANALLASLSARTSTAVQPFVPDPDTDADARALRELYHDGAWTWRR